jgi:ATP-dependent Lon protease
MPDQEWYPNDENEMFGADLQLRAEELKAIPDASPNQDDLIECPVLPLRDMIVLPGTVTPLYVGREATLSAIDEAHANNLTMVALAQRDPAEETPDVDGFLPIGVELAVGDLISLPNDNQVALVQGRRRIEVVEVVQGDDFLIARGRIVDRSVEHNVEFEALTRTVLRLFERFVSLARNLPEETYHYITSSEPAHLADLIVSAFSAPIEEQHALLGELDAYKRLQHVHTLLSREVEVLQVENEINSKVHKQAERGQREAYLREQMRTIQTELGESDPWTKELEELQTKLRKTKLPKEPKKAAFKELHRLGMMPPMSPEVGVIRSFIEWIIDLPWTKKSNDNLDVKHAAEVLDAEHYGLPKAKDRILEYIAVRSLRPKKSRQPILCFVGPPGTGKTSLGKSIAKALGRKFVRLSLGGVRDEAEIRGHRRTYIGALPGRILQTMKRAGTINPLFFLDEVDKLGADMRGDPSSALLEVLDPEQNSEFSDHYLELPYDLSNVMFITTANYRADIPWALLDRMEVVEFPGYIEEEKIEIARRFLIRRQLEESGLEEGELHFSEAALKRIIREYTYEAGVRNLEREIGNLSRKVARRKSEGKRFASRISPAAVEKYLGPPRFAKTEAEGKDEVGVATALAWTEGGGDIMPVEVLLMEGKGNLQITGNIGDIMEESAQAALSYLKSRAKQFKIKLDVFEKTDVHLHIPEGAVPKDGPSAGVTIATAIISAFTGRPVRKDVGLTGEVTLRGRVLAVGGVREKALAAHRAGLKTIVMPARNLKDLVDVPKKALSELEIIPATEMGDVLKVALQPKKAAAKPASKAATKSKAAAKPKAAPKPKPPSKPAQPPAQPS